MVLRQGLPEPGTADLYRHAPLFGQLRQQARRLPLDVLHHEVGGHGMALRLKRSLLLDQSANMDSKGRQITRHGFPDLLKISTQVITNQNIPHPSD
jgi:hypothetical protein